MQSVAVPHNFVAMVCLMIALFLSEDCDFFAAGHFLTKSFFGPPLAAADMGHSSLPAAAIG